MRFLTEDERNMKHFNENVRGCKRRRESKPQIYYIPGCEFITCDPVNEDGESSAPAVCRCSMNNGDGGPTSAFIAKWQERHGVLAR